VKSLMSSTNMGMIVLAVIAVLIAAPLLVIWSLNTLFGLGIAYTLQTWAAVVLLQGWTQSMLTVAKRG